MMIGNAISMFRIRRGRVDPQAQLYIDDAGITDSTEIDAVNNLFVRLQDTPGIWTSISAGLLYLVSPTNVAASYINAVSTASFIPKQGASGSPVYSTNGWDFVLTAHILTGWVPSAQLASINTGLFGWYCNTNTATTGYAMGSLNSGTERIGLIDYNGGDIQFRAYDANNLIDPAVANTIGSYVCTIESNAARHAIKDGINLETDISVVGGALPDFEMVLGARNNAGTIQTHSDRRYGTFLIGTIGLSSANSIELSNAITEYNNNVIAAGR